LTLHPSGYRRFAGVLNAKRKENLEMKKAMIFAGTAVIFLSLFAMKAEAQQIKLGYIDMQKALNEVNEGKNAKAKLKRDFDDKQTTLDKKQDELKRLKDDLDKQSLILKEDQKRERMAELQQKFIELQTLYQKLQKELSEREMTITKEIFEKMEAIIAKIAEEEKLTMVFEKSEGRILYAPPSMDFTNDLIRKYNAKFSGTSTGKK